MKSKIRYIFLLVPISIIVFFAYVISQSQNEASQPLNLELPEFQLQTLDNKTLSEKDLDQVSQKIIEVVKEKTGATIRS